MLEMYLPSDAELSRRGQSLTLNVTSRYHVRQNVEASLAVSVITPLGECYDTWGGFLFETDLAEDVWSISLKLNIGELLSESLVFLFQGIDSLLLLFKLLLKLFNF